MPAADIILQCVSVCVCVCMRNVVVCCSRELLHSTVYCLRDSVGFVPENTFFDGQVNDIRLWETEKKRKRESKMYVCVCVCYFSGELFHLITERLRPPSRIPKIASTDHHVPRAGLATKRFIFAEWGISMKRQFCFCQLRTGFPF